MTSKPTATQNHSSGTVMVIGVFDLFHRGHLELLRKASAFGDRLVVVVNGDRLVGKYKRKPVLHERDRLAIVQALRWVDEAIISNRFDVKPWVRKFRPAKIVHGDDWPRDGYLRQIRMKESDLRRYGVELVFVPYYRGATTTGLLRQIQSAPRV